MDLELIQAESKATVDRYLNSLDRVRKTQDWGCGDDAVAISEAYIGDVVAAVPAAIDRARGANGALKSLVPLVLQLKPATIALCGLQITLHCIARKKDWAETIRTLGGALQDECYGAGLLKHNKKKAKTLIEQVKATQARVGARKFVAKKQAAEWRDKKGDDIGYREQEWSPRRRVVAGGWLLDLVTSTLPNVFCVETFGLTKTVTLHPEALAMAEEIVEEMMEANPVFLPMTEPPLPWTDITSGGPRDQRQKNKALLVRTFHGETKAKVAAACKSGQMAPALAGLNALQAVPWVINERILGVIEGCIEHKIKVKGLPAEYHDEIEFPDNWESMGKEWQREFMQDRAVVRSHNQAVTSEAISLKMDMKTAHMLVGKPRFWTPHNMDFRGRVYPMCNFHFQRSDRVRALFLFADGEAIGEEGLWWLKVHTANCAAMSTCSGKTDKLALIGRVQWVDQNLDKIRAMTECPLRDLWWTEAADPFLFLAASFELITAIGVGPNYIARLPVSFDGSCSGLQHLTAMTRATEGALVNLCPTTVPADIYATVADRVRARLDVDAKRVDWPEKTDETTGEVISQAWRREVSQMALDYGVDRSMVKRNVMTYSYSSEKHGMAGQLQVDLMHALQKEINAGTRPGPHPFGDYSRGTMERPGKAARHLASHTFECIEEVVHRPSDALAFLRKLAKRGAHEAKPTYWVTPVGLPWINRYNVPIIETVELWMYDRGVRVRMRTNAAVGNTAEISKEKAANAISPNFVHALDAAHLLLTVNAAVSEGISAIATVHDSFGCLPSRAARFNAIIREQFVRMYQEHDPLAEVLEQAKCDLDVANHRLLPDPVEKGDLDITGVLDAQFAFA